MASTKDRQRKIERARAQRRVATQAARLRKRRQVQAGIAAAVAIVLIGVGTTWLLGGFDSTPAADAGPTVVSGACSWTLIDTSKNPNVSDIGHPPTDGMATSGTQVMTLATDQGNIGITMDLAKTPCTAASFAYLASKNFLDNTTCFTLDTALKTLQCGDPKSDGTGDPAYQFADENVPPEVASASAQPANSPNPYYKKGDVVLLNTGLSTNGSQFYIIYDDTTTLTAAYSKVGTVTSGMDIVDKVAAGGAVDASGATTERGKPKNALTVKTMTVGEAITPSPSAS